MTQNQMCELEVTVDGGIDTENKLCIKFVEEFKIQVLGVMKTVGYLIYVNARVYVCLCAERM